MKKKVKKQIKYIKDEFGQPLCICSNHDTTIGRSVCGTPCPTHRKDGRIGMEDLREIHDFQQLLLSVASRRLTPENLSERQKTLLEEELGTEWLAKLGYAEIPGEKK